MKVKILDPGHNWLTSLHFTNSTSLPWQLFATKLRPASAKSRIRTLIAFVSWLFSKSWYDHITSRSIAIPLAAFIFLDIHHKQCVMYYISQLGISIGVLHIIAILIGKAKEKSPTNTTSDDRTGNPCVLVLYSSL